MTCLTAVMFFFIAGAAALVSGGLVVLTTLGSDIPANAGAQLPDDSVVSQGDIVTIEAHRDRPTDLQFSEDLNLSGPKAVQHGNSAFDAEEYDNALEAYSSAAEQMPDSVEVVYNTANALLKEERLEDAVLMYDQALRTAEADLSARTAFNLGNALFTAGNFEGAVEAYKTALRLEPDDLDAKHNLELALTELERAEESEEAEEQGEDPGESEAQEEQGQQEQGQQEGDPQGDPQGGQPDESGQPEEIQPSGEEEGAEAGQQEGEQEEGQPSESGASEFEEPDDPVPATGLTEEQAIQLLESVVGDSESFQSWLHRAQGDRSDPQEQDW